MNTFLRFYKYVFRYKKLFFIGIFFILLDSLLVNLTPIVLRQIVQKAEIQDLSRDIVLSLVITFGVVKLFEIFSTAMKAYWADQISVRVARDIRQSVFDYLHKLDFTYHTSKSSGSLISLFKRGDNAVFSYYANLNLWIITSFFNVIFLTILSINIYPKLAIITVVVFILNFIAMYFTLKNNVKTRNILNDADDVITGITVDNMIAFDTVKYFANEEYESSRLASVLKVWKKKFLDYGFSFRIIDYVNGGLINLGMFIVVTVSLYDYVNGSIGIADFVLASSFATLFFPAMRHMVFEFREVAKNYEDLSRYLVVLDEKITVVNDFDPNTNEEFKKKDESQMSIEFRDVHFSYESGKDVLEDINLKIQPGESVAFIGRSGAGKTTMTKLLMRFYDVTQGQILIADSDIKLLDKKVLRTSIGFVPQEAVLFNNSLRYNISYGKLGASDEEIYEACKKANLYDFIQTLTYGLDTQIGERGIKLSGGQKQRLAIARAFLEDAPIIVFDEATSNLDTESERLIQKSLWDLSKDKTTIIIAHRLSTIKQVDRIIVFDEGKIVEQGSHSELLKDDSSIYKYLLKLQEMGEVDA